MNKFHIASGNRTPKIDFNAEDHSLLIEGRSLPENTRQFYEPAITWLEDYLPEDGASILLEMKFTYINSSSLIAILAIIRKLKMHLDRDCTLKINWFYEEDDEDLLSAGEDISNLADIEFEYIELT